MADKKIKLTRPELKRQRDALQRFERYLPMLKLKQQQLQLAVQEVRQQQQTVQAAAEQARGKFEPYSIVLNDVAGVNVRRLSQVEEIKTSTVNVAGLNVPVFEDVSFPQAAYSLFATPTWVDRAISDMREISRKQAELELLDRRRRLLHAELTKIVQRVNLFEKVKIPEARENIRRIRIYLGDEMTASVVRAKIAKGKLTAAGVSGAQLYALPNGMESGSA
jgi:V/A-type H+-transporting ATPase subunit D